MPLTFPLTLSEFFSSVAIVNMTFTLSEIMRNGRTAGGNRIVNEFGTRLWGGKVKLRLLPRADMQELEGLMEVIRTGRASFLVTPSQYNQSALNNGTLTSVTNGYTVALGGMGASQLIKRGTLFSFQFGGRYALHKTAERVTTTSGGVLTADVEPYVKPGWAASAAVQFKQPVCLAGYVPGSYREPSHEAAIALGPSFEWEQIL